MLHQIELPTYNQYLEHIVQIQQKLLAFVCDTNTPLRPLEEDFKRAFNDQVGAWLYHWLQKGKKKTVYDELCSIITYLYDYPALRTQVTDAFRHDIDFFAHLNDPTFVFSFNTQLQKTMQKRIAPLLIPFYEKLFQTGFPACIAPFDRKAFLKIFWCANETLGVCPACDSPKPDMHEQYIRCDIDHFLPKSLYPFLSMHAANLVPLCINCNRNFKGGTDPLDHSLPGPLVESFHPFGKPALHAIKVVVSRKAKGEYQVCLEEATGGTSRRVHSLNRVYHLETCWFERLKAEIELIRKKIENTGKRFLPKGVSAHDVVEALLKEILDDYDQKVGVEYFYVLRSSYACYALHDTEEFESLVELLS